MFVRKKKFAHVKIAPYLCFSYNLKPRLFEWTAPFRSDDYFDPTWMSFIGDE